MIDELIERIDNARSDASWNAEQGNKDRAFVLLTLDDCDALGAFLTKAFGAVMTRSADSKIAEDLACLAGAFEGESDVEDD